MWHPDLLPLPPYPPLPSPPLTMAAALLLVSAAWRGLLNWNLSSWAEMSHSTICGTQVKAHTMKVMMYVRTYVPMSHHHSPYFEVRTYYTKVLFTILLILYTIIILYYFICYTTIYALTFADLRFYQLLCFYFRGCRVLVFDFLIRYFLWISIILM